MAGLFIYLLLVIHSTQMKQTGLWYASCYTPINKLHAIEIIDVHLIVREYIGKYHLDDETKKVLFF